MRKRSSFASANKAWWEKMVREKCGFTVPWLDLDHAVLEKLADGKLKKVPEQLLDIFPVSVLKHVKGKDVLCLASGGGQQSAVFGLLGARVTVVDIAEGQLAGDRKAAEHCGYRVTTIQGDMSDLSALKANSFDLVYQAPSMAYTPDVRKVYGEVARVLRPRGLYRADAADPLSQFINEASWDGKGYRISVPFAVKKMKRAKDKNVFEFRHYLSEAFNSLIEYGFIIEHVEEASADLYQNGESRPGSWEHLLLYAPGLFAILARKKK